MLGTIFVNLKQEGCALQIKVARDREKIHFELYVNNILLECAVDGAPSQIPTLKFLTPQHLQVPPLGHIPNNRIKILFNIFSFICENTH